MAKPERYAEINAKLEGRTVAERLTDPEFVTRYPVARRLPPQSSRLDLLIATTRRCSRTLNAPAQMPLPASRCASVGLRT